MGSTSVSLTRQYASYGGVDIRVVVDGETLGTLQALSYAIQREKAPVYVMGRVDPLSFSRGKRGIAGTLIHLLMDEHLLMKAPFNNQGAVVDNDEIYPEVADLNNASGAADLESVGGPSFTFDASDLGDNYTLHSAWYVDQLPPMDFIVAAVNEYGNAATMRIYGAEILNEGSGFSIDDMVIENQMTYVCRTILPWQKLGSFDMESGGFTSVGGSGGPTPL